jgi:SseB protein N-terminal domain
VSSTDVERGSEPAPSLDLTPFVKRARRGFRRDVQALVAALDAGVLMVPLKEPIDGVPVGQVIDNAESDVSVVPHLLANEHGVGVVPLFSDADILRSVGQYAGWTTGEQGDLDYCTLPARTALDLAQQLVDGQRIAAVVINPADEDELLLQRHELGSILSGKAIPLVGYVSEIAVDPAEPVLVADIGPADPRLVAAIESCLDGVVDVLGYRLEQCFNAERDLEPHPTLTLSVQSAATLDQQALGRRLFAAVEGLLPEPGYIDVLFESAWPNGSTDAALSN